MPRATALLLTALLALPAAAQDQPPEVAPQVDPPAAVVENETQPQPIDEPEAQPEPQPQPEPEPPAAIDLDAMTPAQLAGLLGDADFALRQAAMGKLLEDNTLNTEAILPMVADATGPESLERLLTVAQHHVVRELRTSFEAQHLQENDRFRAGAAVGFSHRPILPEENPYSDRGGSVVTHTMPGFPGFVYLRPGDVILQINGLPCFATSEADIQKWVQNAVTQRAAGTMITMVVARQGEEVELSFEGASLLALNNFYPYSADIGRSRLKAEYQPLWHAARDRLTAQVPAPAPLIPEDAQ